MNYLCWSWRLSCLVLVFSDSNLKCELPLKPLMCGNTTCNESQIQSLFCFGKCDPTVTIMSPQGMRECARSVFFWKCSSRSEKARACCLTLICKGRQYGSLTWPGSAVCCTYLALRTADCHRQQGGGMGAKEWQDTGCFDSDRRKRGWGGDPKQMADKHYDKDYLGFFFSYLILIVKHGGGYILLISYKHKLWT